MVRGSDHVGETTIDVRVCFNSSSVDRNGRLTQGQHSEHVNKGETERALRQVLKASEGVYLAIMTLTNSS